MSDDALREAVAGALTDHSGYVWDDDVWCKSHCQNGEYEPGKPRLRWSEAAFAAHQADAVLAVVAKHRDAETEQLRASLAQADDAAVRAVTERDTDRDRITRALAVVLTRPTTAYMILNGTDLAPTGNEQ